MSTPNAQTAYRFFIEKGWSPIQAAAIVGNLMQESGPNLNLDVVGDAGTAFGIAQWRGDRYTALQNFAAANGVPWNDLATQMAFVDHELRTTERRAGDALRSAASLEDATAAMIGYERPQGWTAQNPTGGHGWANRLNFAAGLAGTPALSHDLGQGAPPVTAGGPTPQIPAENGQNPVVTAPQAPPTPIADAVVRVGQAFSAPQGGPAANQAEIPQTPRLAAADFAENSRNRLAEMTATLMPAPETGLGAAEQPMRAFNQPFAEMTQKPDPFKMLFGPARSAPLGGGTRIRA